MAGLTVLGQSMSFRTGLSSVILRLAKRAQVVGEVADGAEGVGVVVAEDVAAPGEGVLVEVVCGLVVAECAEAVGEVAGGAEGAGVVVAEDAAAPGEDW